MSLVAFATWPHGQAPCSRCEILEREAARERTELRRQVETLRRLLRAAQRREQLAIVRSSRRGRR